MGSDIASLGTGRTGGRAAAGGTIAGRYALAVGKPDTPTPAGWEWRLLTDVAALETGHTPSRRHPEYWDGDIPWLGIKDANEHHGRTIDETTQHVTQAGLDNSSARLLPKGTVCLSRTASIGFITRMGRPMATSQDFVNWICGPELDERFLIYVLLGDRESLLQFAHGSTHQTIYFPEVKAFHICLPPLPEQRAIAGVLGSLDDKIELNRRMNRTLESMARALFRHRFLDHPDPAWEEVELGDMITIERETVKVADHPDETFDHFSLPAFDAGQQPIRELGGAIKSNKFAVPEDAVLISRLNPRIPRVWMPSLSEHARSICSTEFLVCRPGEGITREWLYCFLTGRSFTKRFQGMVTGTTGSHQRVSAKAVPKMSAVRPTAEAVTAFTEVVASLMEQIRLNIAESETLSTLRDTLLPRLLSGELRPPADRGDFEPAEATVRG